MIAIDYTDAGAPVLAVRLQEVFGMTETPRIGAFFLEGKYPQCFSLFGGERRGAPVVGFLRVDEEPILLKCQIKRPNHLILFDLSLTDPNEIEKETTPHGKILMNTYHWHRAF